MVEHLYNQSRRRLIVSVLLALALGAVFALAYGSYSHRHEDFAANAGEAKQLWSCGMHPQVIQDRPGNCPICGMALEPMRDQPRQGAMTGGEAVKIDPVVIQNMGVRVVELTQGPLERTLRAVGYISWAEPRLYDVNLRISGWIEKLHADTEGMAVRKGQPLFELYSPELQVAVEELIAARGSSPNAQQQNRGVSQTLYDASRRKLEQWGVAPAEVERLSRLEAAPRGVLFASPATGELIEKNLVEGAAVMSGQRALRIADRSLLWLDAQVYPTDLPFVKIGQRALAVVEGIPGRSFEAEVVFIDPRVDPSTRAVKIRVALPNADLALRPGMFAAVRIKAQLLEHALLAPREAILDTGTRQVVFVAMAGGHFEPRNVTLGAAGNDGFVQVLSGLSPEDLVVTSGQFLLDAESRMKEAIQKHLGEKLLIHSHPAGAARMNGQPSRPLSDFQSAIDGAVREYLKLSETLGQVAQNNNAADFKPLIRKADELHRLAQEPKQKQLADDLLSASRPLADLPQGEQRSGFKALSLAILQLAEQWPPSKDAAGADGKLFVLYCPMADGYWLQDTDDRPANPYYANEMKSCAEFKRSIKASSRRERD